MKNSQQLKEKKMKEFSDNMIFVKAQSEDDGVEKTEKKKKGGKGNGTNACLVLLKELASFKDSVQTCADAQDIEEIRSKITAFGEQLDAMATALLDIAKQGILTKKDTSAEARSEE